MSPSLCRVSSGRPVGSRSPNLVWKAGLLLSHLGVSASVATHESVHTSVLLHAHECRHKEAHPLTRVHVSSWKSCTSCNYLLKDENRMFYLCRNTISLSGAHTHIHTHPHKFTHILFDAVPQAGRPLHLPHLLCPQLNFDQSFPETEACMCELCVYRVRVFAYTRLRNQRHVASLSHDVLQLHLPSSSRLMLRINQCVCACVFCAAEAPAVFCCSVCWDARWAASHRVTRRGSEGTLGLSCRGRRRACVCVLQFRKQLPVMLFSVCSLCGSLIRQWAGLRPCLRERSLGLLAERLLKDHSAGCVWGGLISSYWSLPLLLLVPSPPLDCLCLTP